MKGKCHHGVESCAYVCEGSKNAKIMESGHDTCSLYGGSSKFGLDRTDTERLFRQLVILGILDEELHVTAQDHTVCYIRLGQRADDVLSGRLKVNLIKGKAL
jgi:bloom syndrome protein